MESLEKSQECSSLRNTHRTLTAEAPDAKPVCPVCCQVPGSVRVRHRTLGTGRGLNPVGASGVA